MEYNNNSIKISYSIYEIMLFATIWTYGLFGAFITRSDSYIVLTFSSLIAILLCYTFLFIDHYKEKETLLISFNNLKIVLILFLLMLLLLNDGLFSWFYNDQSEHVTEAFKHGIFIGKLLPGIEHYSYKLLIHIMNALIFLFSVLLIIFFRTQKNIYTKTFVLTAIFLILRVGIIYAGGTESTHPPLRLLPIFLSSTFFGINEFGIRILQLILVSSFLTYCFTIFKKYFSNLNSILFTTFILTIPLFLFTSLSIEPSIYAFIILLIFLMDIYHNLEDKKFNVVKWIFIISIGSLFRQSIFLLFIPLFIIYLLQKRWKIENPAQSLSPLLLSLPIFLNSLLSGTPSTNNMGRNSSFLDNNYLEIFVDNLGILLSILILFALIPNFKKSKSSLILFVTFIVLFLAFIVVPFYGYEFTYRYHAEYALPFAIFGLYKLCLYLEKMSYNKIITGILVLSILSNMQIYLSIFSPQKVSFQSLLANNFSTNKDVYDFIIEKNYDNQFYYVGPNQRLISKIIYGLSIKNSINSTNPEHSAVETFGTNLNFQDLDNIIENYNVIVIDTFTMENEQLDNSLSPYTLLYDINQQNKMVQYLDSKLFEDKKIFNGSMGFKTLIFVNGKN